MAREKGMGNLQREKSGRWTMRVTIGGKHYARSTRTTDKAKAERALQRFLAPFGLGEHRLPLAEAWNAYVISPNRNDLAQATLASKRSVWMNFAKWMEHNHLEVGDLAGVTPEAVGEYLAWLRSDLCASTYNNRVCVLREIFRVLAAKAGLEEDPWEGVKLRVDDSHSRRELTVEELQRLLRAAEAQVEVEGGGGQRREIAERRDKSVASPCVASVSEAQNEAIPPLITQHSSFNTLSPEMMGELKKMYDVLKGVFG